MQQMYGTAKFILSAGKFEELPVSVADEFAIIGRSNVGKSSFINHVCADHGLARTSKRPGTTICANLFKINEAMYWVDLPGYGYARTTAAEQERWASIARDYCERRCNLRGIVWLVDIRHVGIAKDRKAYAWLRSLGKPVLPALAKTDKLPRSGQRKMAGLFMKEFEGFGEPVLYSVYEHAARERFWNRFETWRRDARPFYV